MKPAPRIGHRIYLEPLLPEAVSEQYVGWLNDPEICRYLEIEPTGHTMAGTQNYVKEIRENPANHLFAIRVSATSEHMTDEHIGNIKLGPVDDTAKTGDIGLMIGDRTQQGKGYATEAIRQITDYAFNTLDLDRVTAGMYVENVGSFKAFEKIGFVEVGREFKEAPEGRQEIIRMALDNPRTLAVVQARFSSTRLPGKVLKPILGEPMLYRQLERIARANRVNQIVVATSEQPDDDPIADLCAAKKIACVRGSLDDVLERFYQAVSRYPDTQHIIRLTGDCPLSDPAVIDQVVSAHLVSGADYTGNVTPPTYPDGLDVEVMTLEALQRAHAEAKLASEREHVTPYFYKHPELFTSRNVENDRNLSALRLTVDEPEDFTLVSGIYEKLYAENPRFNLEDILKVLDSDPMLNSMNADFMRNEGYQKSLEKEANASCPS